MHLFFKESALLEINCEIALDPEDVNHAYRVLRLGKGSAVTVADGKGASYGGVINSISSQEVLVRLLEPAQINKPSLRITLLQSLLKGEKMDLVIRQAVELGVTRIIPVLTERSIPQYTDSREVNRGLRWQKIARSAAAQCRRADLALIEPLCRLEKTFDLLREQPSFVLWELEKKRSLYDLLRHQRPEGDAVLLLLGPEGGFSCAEIEILAAAGAASAHLGPRILRAETAALASIAMLQSVWGDLSSL